MTDSIDRRGFLARLAAAPLGAALAPELLERATPGADRPDGLPPRVVALRTTGGNFRFDPPGLRLEVDTSLIWLNMGDFHTTSAFHPDNAGLLSGEVPLRIPEGARSWHSGMLGLTAGTEFEHRFEVPGVYDYFCQPHYGFGMVGRLVVDEPRGGPGTRPLEGVPEAVTEKMPPVDAITGPRGRGWEWASRLNGVLWLRAHQRDAAAAVSAIEEGVAGDEALAGWLESDAERRAVEEALERFAGQVRDGVGYERLVERADAVKAHL